MNNLTVAFDPYAADHRNIVQAIVDNYCITSTGKAEWYWVKDAYPNDDWKGRLADSRLKKAEELLAYRQSRNQQTDLVDCVQFCDKRDLIIVHESVRKSLCLGEKNTAKKGLIQAEKLRDLLAHSQQDLTEGSSWAGVIEVVEWIETVVHTSDDLVEKNATKLAADHQNRLRKSAQSV